MTLGKVVKSALFAGLVAGVVVAAFHWILTEPLIDRAVEIAERSHAGSGAAPADTPVGRPVQKFGLFVGFLLYGAAWGILSGLLSYAAGPLFAGMSFGKQGFLLALILGWAVALFPLLKYPANPPGVGEPATIGYRQELYLLFVALSLIGTTAALWVERRLRRSRTGRIVVVMCYAVFLGLIFAALPENPDAVRLPAAFIRQFRIFSFFGQALFWIALGGSFWWLNRRSYPYRSS